MQFLETYELVVFHGESENNILWTVFYSLFTQINKSFFMVCAVTC